MINKIPNKYDLTITYSWRENISHGICGHLFEMVEYYYILKNHFKVCMMICEDISWSYIETTIRSKYTFTDTEILDMKNNILFFDYPRIIKGQSLLMVDGSFSTTTNKVLAFDNIMAFPCNDLMFQSMDDVVVFQDDRIYDKGHNTINYRKKILFSKYKTIDHSKRQNLLYATTQAKQIPLDYYKKLEELYDGDFLLLSENKIDGVSERFIQDEMPISDFFEQFDRYVYTPTPQKRDCSPRLLAECKFYGKDVEYFNIDYLDVDLGLRYRIEDIENNFGDIFLQDGDDLIHLLGEIL